jgi:alpha-D-ribose 1-methylphosphonate 5-triphosphate synthase subunit PhnH
MSGWADSSRPGGAGHADLVPGFRDPVHDAQASFRAILDAMAHPGRIRELPVSLAAMPPAPLGIAAAAIALALCDIDTPIWLDLPLAAAAPYLAFHCGAPTAIGPTQARFAFAANAAALPPLESFALGSDEYPDRSTTLVVEVAGLIAGHGMRLTGPGIRDDALLSVAGLPARLWEERAMLAELLPRGLDMILVSGARLVALPRWTRVTPERR